MKKLFAAFILCAFTSLGLSARTQNDRPVTLKGHAVTEEKAPVDYATVMLTAKADSTKVYGSITDEKGGFTVEMPKGSYRLKISFMGYDSFEREVNLAADTDLGELTMKPSSVMLDEVVVTANMVTREADRFVVNVAATPLSAGKTGKERLALSPGVWITDKGDLSVNGRGGTQVIVNDRVLKETGEELVAYLENLKAEDILKIEVIPYAGAEYDANATGGVIKITLKKQREEGLEGAVSMRYYTSIVDQKAWNYQPSLNLNYKYNALSLYSKVGYRRNNWTGGNMESDRFLDRDRIMDANTGMAHRQSHTTFQLGSVYDINDKQSVGAEFNMTENPYHNNTDGTALAIENGNSLTSQSLSRSTTDYSLMSFTANYSLKLDTLGSTFKTVANYTYRNKEDSVYYHTNYSGMMNYDSTSRYMPTARYDMFAIRSDFDIALSKSSKLATGLKYQRNTMDNVNPYDYFKNDIWIPLPERSSINKYTENIGALYASFSTKFRNNTSLLVGLRGEYTYAVPATNSQYVSERQKYFDLFPNANLSIPLNKKQSQMIILGYGRKIGRPSFWQLSPFRQQLSDYMFMEGNPKLKPSYTNDYTLTWVLFRKYTLTLGAQEVKDAFSIIVDTDPSDSNIQIARQSNMPKRMNYNASLSIPAQITKWWMLNANLNGSRNENTLMQRDVPQKEIIFTFRGNMSNTFTFKKNYNFMIEAFYMSPSLEGNVRVGAFHMVNAGLKGNFFDKKLTATFYVYNIFDMRGSTITFQQDNTYTRFNQWGNYRSLGLSLRYSFQAGKKIRVKTVDGSEQDNGGGGGGGF